MLGERDKVKKPFWGKKKKKALGPEILKWFSRLKKEMKRGPRRERRGYITHMHACKNELNEGEQIGCPLWIWPCFPELWVLHALAQQPQLQLHPRASAQLPSHLPHHHNKLWGYEQRGGKWCPKPTAEAELTASCMFLTKRAKDYCENRDLVGSEPASRKGGSAVAAARASMSFQAAGGKVKAAWKCLGTNFVWLSLRPPGT